MINLSEEEIIKTLKRDMFMFSCEQEETIQGLLELYNKEKENNRKLDRENQALYESINCDDKTMLERLYKEEKEVTKLQERIIKLMISDFQSEGIFKDMKYESIIEYYKRRKDL